MCLVFKRLKSIKKNNLIENKSISAVNKGSRQMLCYGRRVVERWSAFFFWIWPSGSFWAGRCNWSIRSGWIFVLTHQVEGEAKNIENAVANNQRIRHLFFDLYYNSSFLILWIISLVMSLLAQYFARQQFCVLVEYLSAHQAQWSVKTEFSGFCLCANHFLESTIVIHSQSQLEKMPLF